MIDASVIDAGGSPDMPLMARWGEEWGEIIRGAVAAGTACNSYNAGIIGQAVAGALHQAARECARGQQCRTALADNLTRFLVRALRPGLTGLEPDFSRISRRILPIPLFTCT